MSKPDLKQLQEEKKAVLLRIRTLEEQHCQSAILLSALSSKKNSAPDFRTVKQLQAEESSLLRHEYEKLEKLEQSIRNAEREEVHFQWVKATAVLGVVVLLAGVFLSNFHLPEMRGTSLLTGAAIASETRNLTSAEPAENLFSLANASYTALLSDGSLEETHYSAVAGKPVKWTKKIIPKFADAPLNAPQVKIPSAAENLSIIKTDAQSQRAEVKAFELKKSTPDDGLGVSSTESPALSSATSELILEEIAPEYEITFTTEAPQIIEESLSLHRKKITISSATHYENITTTISLPQESIPEKITLLRTTNGTEETVQIINYTDLNANGLIDQVTWIVPSLSNQTYELIIEIIKAQHLDENRTFISDIYSQVQALDGSWSEPIYNGDFIRVTFEKNLTPQNDITIYVRNNLSAEAKVEVYYFNSTQKITEIAGLEEEGYYSTYLTGMNGSHDTFDLKIIAAAQNNKDKYKFKNAFLEFDHIIDPVAPETTFVSNDEAHDVKFALLNESTGLFVMAWCDDIDDAAYFSLQYANGSTYLDKTAIDTVAGDSCRIDVDALNSTSFVVGYLDWVTGASAWKTVGYDITNATLFGSVTIDADLGSNADVGVCALNSTDYVSVALDNTDNDATFTIYNGATAKVGQVDSDSTMAPDSGSLDQDNVDCAVLNPNLFVFSYFDDNPDQIVFSIHNDLGQGIKNRTNVKASSLDGATALAALSTNGFVLAYCDSTDDDVSFTVFNNSGIATTAEIDVNDTISSCSGAGGTHLDVSALNTLDGRFAIIYDNTLVDRVYLAVYNATGTQILAPQQIEATSDTVEKTVAVLGYEKNSNHSLCQFTPQPTLLMAYNDATNGVWGTYYANGSLWDGNCVNSPPTITSPLLNPLQPRSNDTLIVSTTYNHDYGNPGMVYFQWYVNGNNTYNETNTSVTNGTLVFSSLPPQLYNSIINVSIYASNGISSSLLQWSSNLTVQSLIPKDNENDGPEGTNLSQYNDETLQNISNLRWHRNGKAKIQWKVPVNLSNSNIGNDADLDDDIEIGTGWASVNSSEALVLNAIVNITLENVDCSRCHENNIIYAAGFYTSLFELRGFGQSCSLSGKCSNFSCADGGSGIGNCTFDVTGFSGYAVGGNANLTINDSVENSNIEINLPLTYFAYYINASDGTSITGASCNVTDADGTNPLVETAQNTYNYTKTVGFTSSGLKNWNVTCSKTGYTTLFANDTLSVKPTAPVLLLLPNNSTTINRTPTFVWNNSLGGTSTTYNFILDDNPAFNNPEINVTGIVNTTAFNTTYTIETELAVDTIYYWKVRGNDSSSYGNYSNTFNFTLQSYLAISLLRTTVNFGEVSSGINLNTSTGTPLPFLAENSGNIFANVTITATPYFSKAAFPSSTYQFRVEENESGAFNLSQSAVDWTNMNNISASPHVYNLDWHYFKNDFQAGININIPLSEPQGVKSSTVTFEVG